MAYKFERVFGLTMVALVTALSGCRPKSNRVSPLCKFDMASESELSSRALPAEAWLGIVEPSLNRTTMIHSGPHRDSCGRIAQDLTQDKAFVCPGVSVAAEPVAGDVAEISDLVMSQAGEDQLLLWAATEELVGGEAQGPMALVWWTDAGIEIHATGLVRGYRAGARMRLHHLGTDPVLVLESDRCDAANHCIRVGQFIPVIGRRFREAPLYSPTGECFGRAQFDLSREQEIALDDHRMRRFRLTRTIELQEDGVALIDLVTAEDYDKRYPDTPATPFRKASSNRPLHYVDGHLELRDEDLWDRVLRDGGAVRACS